MGNKNITPDEEVFESRRIIHDKLRNEIYNEKVLDSEIIQDIERMKQFDINYMYIGDGERTLLMHAVNKSREELVKYFLRVPGINVNYKNLWDGTALNFSRKNPILKLLLDHRDIDVNIQNNWGLTGLHGFCYRGYETCVRELLLDAHVNVLIRND